MKIVQFWQDFGQFWTIWSLYFSSMYSSLIILVHFFITLTSFCISNIKFAQHSFIMLMKGHFDNKITFFDLEELCLFTDGGVEVGVKKLVIFCGSHKWMIPFLKIHRPPFYCPSPLLMNFRKFFNPHAFLTLLRVLEY